MEMIKLNKEVDMGIVILGYLFERGEKVSASEIARDWPAVAAPENCRNS